MSGVSPAPNPEIMRRIGVLIGARQIPRAIELAREELDRGAEHPQLLHLRSTWSEQAGRPLDALADLERARALDPKALPILMALGGLLARLNRRIEARDAFTAASALRPDLPGPAFELGQVCESTGEIDKAQAAFTRLLDLDPGHAGAAARLASIAAQQGQWDEARTYAERALALAPRDAAAHLAYARADAEQGRLADAERRLQTLLNEPLPPEQFYLAQNQLGALWHGQGRPDEAFSAWVAGNEAVRQRYAPMFAGPKGVPALLRWLNAEFSAQSPWPASPLVAKPSPPATHVFLFGFTRSGTTLLEQVLALHPAVVALEEKELLTEAVQTFQCSPAQLAALQDATDSDLARVREAYWREVSRFDVDPAGKIFVDKSPFNGLRLPLIARLFPRAKLLFAIRDPRDVVFSSFRTPMRITGLPYELLTVEGAAVFYAAYMELVAQYRTKLPLDLFALRHEDLLEDFEGKVREVCDFIGIDYRPEMLAFNASSRKVATPSAHQLRAGLNRSGVGQWRPYAAQMAPALPHLAPWVSRFGYPE